LSSVASGPPRGGVSRRVPGRNCVATLVLVARVSTPWSLLDELEEADGIGLERASGDSFSLACAVICVNASSGYPGNRPECPLRL